MNTGTDKKDKHTGNK